MKRSAMYCAAMGIVGALVLSPLAAGSLFAATVTWSGAGDGTTWSDGANWGGTAPAAGDTATFNGNVTFNGDVVLPGNLTISVASGKTVTINGVVSGTGNLTKSGAGNLKLLNAANTYDGATTLSAGNLYYMTIANVGEASSLGQPTTVANGMVTISGGNFYAVTRSTVAAMETDRTIHMTGGTFYVGEIKGTDANITITLKGPYTGTRLSVRGLGNLRIESYLGTSVTWIGRTDGGTVEFLNPTNRTTASLGISDGIIRVAGLGKPSALGSGSKVTMGQTAYSTIGRLFYNGTTNAVCDRGLAFSAFTNSTMSYVNLATSGGRVRNETPGTCVTLTGPISLSMPDMSRYPAATAYIWIEGPGDGVVTSDIAGRARLSHEQGGTWSYKGNYTATGIISVSSNCRFELDGMVSAEKDSTLNNKLQVNSGGTLAGTGTIHGASAVYSGGTLAAGSTNRCGTLTFGANPLTLANGSKLLFKVGAETNDRVVVGGDIVMSGAATTTVTLAPFGAEAIPAGSYTLMTWTATPGGKFVLADGAPEGARLVVDARGLKLVVASAADTLVWKGDGTANAWDLTSENWLAGVTAVPFTDGASVLFDDTGSSDPAVTFATDVAPLDVTVNTTSNYVFAGEHGLSGDAMLTKKGTGVLTLANRNAYTGATTVEEGALVVSGALDDTSISTAYGASFTNTSTGVIGGTASIYLRYGNHYLGGNNTFTGDVTFDSRGDSTVGNCFLYLNGPNALGRAKRLIQFSHSSALDKNSRIYLDGSTIIRGVTLVYGKDGGSRMYLNKPSNNSTAGWYGDIVDAETGPGAVGAGYVVADGSGPFQLGDPAGTNEICTTGGFTLRGGGTLHCYSRINRPGKGVNRDDPGTAILYNTNNVFSTLQTSQGEFRPAVAGAIPTNALITVGKAGTTSSISRFNLNGIDVTVAGLSEISPEAKYELNKRYVTSSTPATLTVNGDVDRAWGSIHSWIQSNVSIVKAGPHTWTLNGTNTYTGATTVQEGTLVLNSANAIGGSTNVVLTGGTISARASGAFNADGTLTVPDPANGTLSRADGTTQTVEYLVVGGVPQPAGTYTKAKAGASPRLAFLARGEGSGTLLVRKGSGFVIIFR